MKEVYPCVLAAEKVGYSVIFPDIAGATQGETLYEALKMAEDFAGFAITSMLEDGEEIPKPTPLNEIELEDDEFATLIRVDTDEYRKNSSEKLELWYSPNTKKRFTMLADDNVEVYPIAEQHLRRVSGVNSPDDSTAIE